MTQGKEEAQKHKQMCGIFGGAATFCLCVLGVISYEKKTHKLLNKIPPQIPRQSREILVYMLFLYIFSLPMSEVSKRDWREGVGD